MDVTKKKKKKYKKKKCEYCRNEMEMKGIWYCKTCNRSFWWDAKW